VDYVVALRAKTKSAQNGVPRLQKWRVGHAGARRLTCIKTLLLWQNFLEGDIDMATAALPIRELSANVQFEAASANKMYWNELEARRQKRLKHREGMRAARKLAAQLTTLEEAQVGLIKCLQTAPETLKPEHFSLIAQVLDLVVSITNATIDNLCEEGGEVLSIWSDKLEKVAELNDHIESFSESFRIAADEACTALLAGIACQAWS
jgi:hypothetical protein